MKNTILLIVLGILLAGLCCIAVYYFINAIRILFSTTKKAPYIPSFDRQLELTKPLKLKKYYNGGFRLWRWKSFEIFSKEHNIKL